MDPFYSININEAQTLSNGIFKLNNSTNKRIYFPEHLRLAYSDEWLICLRCALMNLLNCWFKSLIDSYATWAHRIYRILWTPDHSMWGGEMSRCFSIFNEVFLSTSEQKKRRQWLNRLNRFNFIHSNNVVHIQMFRVIGFTYKYSYSSLSHA